MVSNIIQQAVVQIKTMIEDAIITNGINGKNNLIRSQKPINVLHDAVKQSFISNGVNPSNIYPTLHNHSNEQTLAGFFKKKDQDICIFPNNITPQKEILTFDGILNGKIDNFGKNFTEHILSINVRSQLSSIEKNFDTLSERTVAEALNLHLRCEKMVLGEVYMIPVYAYDDEKAKHHQVAFKNNKKVKNHIKKYTSFFNAINNRKSTKGAGYKYERVCLLIVDFSSNIPIIYSTDKELKNAGLLDRTDKLNMNQLNFDSFSAKLLNVYEKRFGYNKLI